jgi:hypothetical protein
MFGLPPAGAHPDPNLFPDPPLQTAAPEPSHRSRREGSDVRRRGWVPFARGALCATLLALALLQLLLLASERIAAISSDDLYMVALYRDTFSSTTRLVNWVLQPAPGFLPDMPLFFLAQRFTRDPGHAFTTYMVVSFGALLVLLRRFASTTERGGSVSPIIWAGSAVILLCLLRDHRALSLFLLPGAHGSALILGLALFLLLRRAARRGWCARDAIAVLVVGAAATWSDLIFGPQALVPLVATALVAWALGILARRVALSTVALAGFVVVLSMLLMRLQHRIFVHPPDPPELGLERWRQGMSSFFQTLHTPYHAGVLALVVPALLCAIGVLLFCRRRLLKGGWNRYHDLALGALFITLVCSATTAAGIINWVDEGSLRYVAPLYVLPVFCLPAWLAATGGHRRTVWIERTVLTAVALVLALPMLAGGMSMRLTGLALPYPPWIECLDTLARSEGLHYGYGDYWNAKYASMLSHAGVLVNQLDEDLTIFPWINNLDWYLAVSQSRSSRVFLLPERLMEPGEAFGRLLETRHCGEREIRIYRRPTIGID